MTVRLKLASALRRLLPYLTGAALSLIALPAATPMGTPPAAFTRATPSSLALQGPEAQLVRSLFAIRHNQMGAALEELERLIEENPNFRLAHLIRGDLLLARSRPIEAVGAAADAPPEQIEDFRDEIRARLARHAIERPVRQVPRYLLRLNPSQRHALVVDTSLSTLYVFENVNGEARYVTDFYITSGKNGVEKLKYGDKKTPLGVYHAVEPVPREKLTDFYGPGAWPINYPNEWDKRHRRRGYGIWVHGTPSDTYARPPRASDGCVVLTNADLEALSRYIVPGSTPVIIAERIEWSNPSDLRGTRESLLAQVHDWRVAQEGADTDRYLAFYSRDFRIGQLGHPAWVQQARDAAAGRGRATIALDQMSMFLYPGNDGLALVEFVQDVQAAGAADRARVRQYWKHEDGRWRIVHEGPA